MLGEKHDLIHELPEYKNQIHQLKVSDVHFAKVFEKYHDIDREILRIEEGIETASDDYLEQVKKLRLALKDELFNKIKSISN